MSVRCSDTPDYSIVVPAFNEEAFLPATLEAMRDAMASVPYEGEVIVCDNNSTDGTAEVARAAGARVVFEEKNQISRARNTGARAARGRWLVWVDADTRLPGELLQAAIDSLESGRAVGGGSVIRLEGRPGRLFSAFVELWTRISLLWGLAAGSFVFCLREAFDDVGGFSEQIYASEEIWFSRAIKRWGKKRGLKFELFTDHPAVTSPRKAEWYSMATIIVVLTLFTVLPFLVRSKRFCFLWYRRPDGARTGNGS